MRLAVRVFVRVVHESTLGDSVAKHGCCVAHDTPHFEPPSLFETTQKSHEKDARRFLGGNCGFYARGWTALPRALSGPRWYWNALGTRRLGGGRAAAERPHLSLRIFCLPGVPRAPRYRSRFKLGSKKVLVGTTACDWAGTSSLSLHVRAGDASRQPPPLRLA